jgi:hypothetical protein
MTAQPSQDDFTADCDRNPAGAYPRSRLEGPQDGANAARDLLVKERSDIDGLIANIDKTLDERGSRYGKFTGHAEITQRLKDAMRAAPKWSQLKPDQMEALEMVQHKIGRILNGDPDYIDSWHDIAGYVTLVERRLEGKSV